MDEQNLIDAVYEDPDDDDSPRVYADWLEENGQADRAALLRAQLELERFSPKERREELFQRTVELSQRCVAALPLRQSLRDRLRIEIERGLVRASIPNGTTLDDDDLRELGSVRELKTLEGVRALSADRLARLTLCPNVTRLVLSYYSGSHRPLTGEDWDAIAALPHIDALDLEGEDNNVDDVAAGIVKMRRLREFTVRYGGVTDSTVPSLARLRRLEVLRIHGSPQEDRPGITDAGLAGLTGLKRLRELDVSGTELTDAGLVHLLKFPRLVCLSIGDLERVTGNPVPVLVRLKKLRKLSVNALDGIDDAGAAELARRLPRLRELDLSRTSVTRLRLAQLIPKTKWKKLHLEASLAVIDTWEHREVKAFEELCREHDVFVDIDYE